MPSWTSEQEQFYKSLLVMTILGVGHMIGGFTLAYVIKKTDSNHKGLIYLAVVSVIAFTTLIVYTAIFKFNYLSIALGFTFGLMDSGTSTHVSMLLGFEFGDKSVIAFGIQNCIKSSFFGIGALVSSFT